MRERKTKNTTKTTTHKITIFYLTIFWTGWTIVYDRGGVSLDEAPAANEPSRCWSRSGPRSGREKKN